MKNKVDSVCIVDDDLIYQYLAKEEIEFTDMVSKIMFFDDGEKAIQFILEMLDKNKRHELPDIIFLDVNMPVMDGWEFLEAYILLKPRLEKNIVIYLVSSSIDMRDMDRAREISEVSDYIIKPVSGDRLQAIFTELLG
ncbi:response regulator [Parasediminibacterium sp. JCM 36343]|uniref:response regulator n=1 Tax=Parasediminibacterium sp. JCM 36343 TaxID=3374279 RepID=UPI00397864F9